MTTKKTVRARARPQSPKARNYRNSIKARGIFRTHVSLPVEITNALADMPVDLSNPDPRNGVFSSVTAMITAACAAIYNSDDAALPPLVAAPKVGRASKVGWYAPEDLVRRIKILAARHNTNVSQLVASAVAERYKDYPAFKNANIETGAAPYLRAPY